MAIFSIYASESLEKSVHRGARVQIALKNLKVPNIPKIFGLFSGKTDIYALGGTLIEAMTGSKQWQTDECPSRWMQKLRADDPFYRWAGLANLDQSATAHFLLRATIYEIETTSEPPHS